MSSELGDHRVCDDIDSGGEGAGALGTESSLAAGSDDEDSREALVQHTRVDPAIPIDRLQSQLVSFAFDSSSGTSEQGNEACNLTEQLAPVSPPPRDMPAPHEQAWLSTCVEPAGTSETPEDASWRRHPKHLVVLTSSGKPIYSYHGDANSLAGLAALVAALVGVIEDQGDSLHHVIAGPLLIVFMSRGALYFVATSTLGEPVLVLQQQLELVYRQIVLILTSGLERILLRNPAYDAHSLMEGVAPVLTSLLDGLQRDASYLLARLQPLLLPSTQHSLAAQALAEAVKSSGAVYGLLLAVGARVVAVERGMTSSSGSSGSSKPAPPLDASDLLVLDNFVAGNASIRQGHGEAFCPLCLPSFSSTAFLHAYIHFLEPGQGCLYLVLLAAASDAFHALSGARVVLEQQLQQAGVVPALQAAARDPHALAVSVDTLPKPLGGKYGHTALWHFMARLGAKRQVVQAVRTEPFVSPQAQRQLAVAYAQVHGLVWDTPPGARCNKLVWLATDCWAILAQLDSEEEVCRSLALQCATQSCNAFTPQLEECHCQHCAASTSAPLSSSQAVGSHAMHVTAAPFPCSWSCTWWWTLSRTRPWP
ncbi:trafficking protein Mon1-domain-containing protein [Haematococcus lacustris]